MESDFDAITDLEKERLFWFERVRYQRFEDVYYQFINGLIDESPFRESMALAYGMITPSSQIKIQMESLCPDSKRLTGHLKNSDFFDVPNFPTAEFVITSLSENGGLTGNLTMRGVTNSVTCPAEIDVSDGSVALKAEFDIKRFDWGIAYKGKVDDLICDEVVILLDVAASTDA